MSDLIFRPKGKGGEIVFGADAAKGAKLVFTQEQRNSPDLVFGAGGAAQQGTPDPAYVYLDVDTGAISAELHFAVATPVSGEIDCGAVGLDLRARWDSNTYRPVMSKAAARFQAATQASLPICAPWGATARANHGACVRKQQTKGLSDAFSINWLITVPLGVRSQVRWQPGRKASTLAAVAWQSAFRARSGTAVRWQQGRPAGDAAFFAWQSGKRASTSQTARWQHGTKVAAAVQQVLGNARIVSQQVGARWQPGMPPPPGIGSQFGDGAQPDDGRIIPRGGAVDLVFCRPAHGTGSLIFGFCGRRRRPGEKQTLIVPALDVYMHIHDLSATLWPSGEPVVFQEVTISTDEGGYAWQLSATGPVWLMEQLAPKDGQPQMVRIEIDGLAWIFAVQSRGRSRAWPDHSVSITGASATSALDALPVATFANTEQRMAQQLVREALELTGTTVDWRIPDWQVPAGAWSHQGTPLSAVLRVADAVGAVVQSHPAAQTLIYMPRYSSMPWEWGGATPDVVLPIGYAETDSLEEVREPAYNKVYTAGTVAGSIKPTRRFGTPGDVLAPMVTDALLTDSPAHTERAKAVLGRCGWRANVTMTLPVNTTAGYPGVLPMGGLVGVADTDGEWRGMVRSVSIKAEGGPVVNQTVTLERHLA